MHELPLISCLDLDLQFQTDMNHIFQMRYFGRKVYVAKRFLKEKKYFCALFTLKQSALRNMLYGQINWTYSFFHINLFLSNKLVSCGIPRQNKFKWNIFFQEKYLSKSKVYTLTVQNNLKLRGISDQTILYGWTSGLSWAWLF